MNRNQRSLTDAELVGRVRAGETAAYAHLVDRYRDALYGLAFHHLQDFEDARDAAQEALVQAFLRLEQLREPEKFGPWLRQVTANECRMWRRQRRPALPLEEGTPFAGGAEQVEERLAVRQALSCLSEASRLTITLFYLRSYSLQEIAAFLEVPVTTVKSRLRNARARLRKELSDMVEGTMQRRPEPEAFARQVLQVLDGAAVLSVAFSPDGKRVVTGGKDKMVKVRDAGTGEVLRTLAGHGRAVDEVAFSPDGAAIASASRDRTVRLWDAAAGTPVWTVTDHGRPYSLAFNTDGEALAHASALFDADYQVVTSRAVLRDAATGALLRELEVIPWNTPQDTLPEASRARRGMLYSVAFAPGGARSGATQLLATGSSVVEDGGIVGGEVKLWDARTGETRHVLSVPEYMIKSVAFSPDGRVLAGGGTKIETEKAEGGRDFRAVASQIRVWDVSTGKPLRTLAEEPYCAVQSLAFSPDGRTLAVYRLRPRGSEALVLDWQTGERLQTFAQEGKAQSAVAFSPDGRTLACGGADNAVTLWDIR